MTVGSETPQPSARALTVDHLIRRVGDIFRHLSLSFAELRQHIAYAEAERGIFSDHTPFFSRAICSTGVKLCAGFAMPSGMIFWSMASMIHSA